MNKEVIFDQIFTKLNGYSISDEAKTNHKGSVEDILYGEVSLDTLKQILNDVNKPLKGIFYDLGSGTGKAIIAAHLLNNFQKYVGVELLKGLYDESLEVLNEYKKLSEQNCDNIVFENDDFLNTDLHDGGFILINHPTVDRNIFKKLEQKMKKELKTNTIIITTIRQLEDKCFQELWSKKYKFSWGDSTIYVHKKNPV